ncbi:hypothetical protein BDA96_02G134400 [Sorghum bicolor]|uniref:Uncharacterized protein n=1 Tax=Sorghum bicolor TaxID=4558 RepID=A0A921RM56_SORBI|nr:hypothetical protein BDA96_02G134400 [Sorghum bicolor]KAG0542793.1 hypothetical protein BDA96_02G134400 [Sorghum bicolor]
MRPTGGRPWPRSARLGPTLYPPIDLRALIRGRLTNPSCLFLAGGGASPRRSALGAVPVARVAALVAGAPMAALPGTTCSTEPCRWLTARLPPSIMTIPNGLHNGWFKKDYRRLEFDQKHDTPLDDVDVVFHNSEVKLQRLTIFYKEYCSVQMKFFLDFFSALA